jgi:primary-amine oxidase
MKFTVSSLPSLAVILLLLDGFATLVAGLPKAQWAKQRAKGHARRALAAAMEKRQYANTSLCVIEEALKTTAPKENVWGSLSDEEASSIVHWLFAQSDLNLTVMEDAGNWDNTL